MALSEVRGARAVRGCARILAGRYRLDALIGSGGASDVYRGFDLRLRRPVAVKMFRAGTGFDTEEIFRSEAEILARLQHPGLVTAFDAGHHDGDAFLVMQLIDGHTLKSRIAEGPLSCEAAAALGAALAEALAHTHEVGIVHRDVKPSNIILDSSGRPHLTDFGISRLLDATTRTATATMTGTAAYLSPEQVLGRPVGRPADIYALGLVLLECLTGRLEYDGGPLEAAIARLHRAPALPDSLPEGFAGLLRDMTSLEEQGRPTARDCARALTRLVGTGATSPVASVARPALSAVPPTTADPADCTRRSLTPVVEAPSAPHASTGLPEDLPRSASTRGRLRTRGAVAALAALVAAGLLVTDGFSHRDSAGEAAPSAPDPVAPSTRPDTPAHNDDTSSARATPARNDDTSSAPATPPSRSPSAPVQPLRHAVPTLHDHRPVDSSPRATHPVGKAVGKGRAKDLDQPPGQARKTQKGKKSGSR
ncbi:MULTISPECIES: serine/threonine protein kinase [unclassified Streptomyces]|uniref:serine/threonine protein kinase n=1 Tax=unclassified Streptomyces TaxID=2593676 RepID=UPI00211BB0D2|nr:MULTISPECIES: serine/threonine protein kinase [unclassified Streptomyces]